LITNILLGQLKRVLLQVSIGIALANLKATTHHSVHHPRTERFVELAHPSLVGFARRQIHDAHPAGDGIERLPVVQDLRRW
jgi:hypothetical protein